MNKNELTNEEAARLPALQGEDNEYGEYDCYANEKPADYHGRRVRNCHCDSCGREVRVGFESCHYFYTIDGWDSMSYTECRRCSRTSLRNRIKSLIRKIRFRRKRIRTAKSVINNSKSADKLTKQQKKELIELLSK